MWPLQQQLTGLSHTCSIQSRRQVLERWKAQLGRPTREAQPPPALYLNMSGSMGSGKMRGECFLRNMPYTGQSRLEVVRPAFHASAP